MVNRKFTRQFPNRMVINIEIYICTTRTPDDPRIPYRREALSALDAMVLHA